MKIKVLNGPNLNMLGYRNQTHYGALDYQMLCDQITNFAKKKNIHIEHVQSNHEGVIIDEIHALIKSDEYSGLIINPGAFTHYSYAIRDALEMLKLPKVEVHLSNIKEREDFRKISVVTEVCNQTIYGKQINSYYEAIEYILEEGENK